MDGRGAAFGWPLLFGDSTLRTFVYVDAFNLYYGALRKSVLLHGFTKKTQATPQADLDLAKDRLKQLRRRIEWTPPTL